MDSPLVELAARGAPAGAALGDRGAAGVRDTPSDRALSAPRSRRQARDGRPATAGPRRQARDGRPATKNARRAGPRRRAHDALPGGSQCPPTDFRWRPLTRPRPVRRLPRPQCRHYGRPLRRRSGHSTDRATHGPPVRRGPDLSLGLWAHFDADPRVVLEDAIRRQYAEMFAVLPTPTFITYGNVDVPALWPEFARPGVHVLDGEVAEIGGLRVGFVGGGLHSPMRTPYELSEDDYAAKAAAVGAVDVLCCHIPPAVPELLYDTEARRLEGKRRASVS